MDSKFLYLLFTVDVSGDINIISALCLSVCVRKVYLFDDLYEIFKINCTI